MTDLRFRSLEEYRELHEDRIKELESRVSTLEQYFSASEKQIFERILNLEEAIKHHGDRLHALEEKERLRAMKARDEHERDVS